jgi:hypothetical protein
VQVLGARVPAALEREENRRDGFLLGGDSAKDGHLRVDLADAPCPPQVVDRAAGHLPRQRRRPPEALLQNGFLRR